MKFTVLHNDSGSSARSGSLELPHGTVQTPVFMPVGTQASVKALDKDDIEGLGFSLILANTYHLYLRPGSKVIRDSGGLHGFTGWKGNFLTDSGGYQVFSLAHLRKILPEGVRFRSHLDGSIHMLSPESVVDVQCDLNSDIQMALDVCTAPGITEKKAYGAMKITNEWAVRARDAWLRRRDEGYQGALFGIVQGNFYENLRTRCALELAEMNFPGYAIGGLSVGEDFTVFRDILAHTAEKLPATKPRYLMGIGTPEYILEAVENGIDMFDCVFPTRVARNGLLFTRKGRLSIKNERYTNDQRPVEEEGPIKEYSRAYLRHLIKSDEILGLMLATRHNLYFLRQLVDDIRTAIAENRFPAFKKSFLEEYGRGIEA